MRKAHGREGHGCLKWTPGAEIDKSSVVLAEIGSPALIASKQIGHGTNTRVEVCQATVILSLFAEEEGVFSMANIPLNIIVHVQGLGDLTHHESEWAGTKGQARRLEGFQIGAPNGPTLKYMAHLQDIGDTSWVPNGTFVGTRGQSKRLEGFAIQSTSGIYTVRYRAHLDGIGDTGWASNGAFCGTRSQSRRLEAIWVEIRRGNDT